MIEHLLFDRLKDQVTNVSERIYPSIAPSGTTKPYLTYSLISPGRVYGHEGFAELSQSRYQVSVFTDSYASAKATAKQVKDAFEGWKSGDMRGSQLAGESDLYEHDTKTYHIPLDFWVWHNK